MWTVFNNKEGNMYSNEGQNTEVNFNEDYTQSRHAYLILSTEDSTRVLQIGTTLHEIAASNMEIETEIPSFNVGNVLDNKGIVQIHERGVILLHADTLMAANRHNIDGEVRIISSSISDPYILIAKSDDTLEVMEVMDPFQLVSRDPVKHSSGVSACCLFRDTGISRIFNRSKSGKGSITTVNGSYNTNLKKRKQKDLPELRLQRSKDPEDTELYSSPQESTPTTGIPINQFYTEEDEIIRPVYCALCRNDGALEV
eukprot:TRINITY_DN9646_c0_g1_i1.p1 TRINITY_DN9646_c0_g1~~TRINITY_DN9646_c0_g1_i1.p1  ORF type:complete len:256 (+),score=27.66 TRINITY_DN9646_c0_g1_i1:95-862(+)